MLIDKGLIELLGPTSVVFNVYSMSSNLSQYQNGRIFNNIFVFSIALLAFSSYFVFFGFNYGFMAQNVTLLVFAYCFVVANGVFTSA